ncbi:mitochondrial genome maintenance exonuclease 1 isoform X3 [Stigmatopora nigra]
MSMFKSLPFASGISVRLLQTLFCLPASQRCISRKGDSPYTSVDSERYSSLVKSVLASKVSSQTPATIQAEDEQIFGPVVKAQTPSRPELKLPKAKHPFLLGKITPETEEIESELPARFVLNRDRNSSMSSVTRILQATLSPEQLFYLERWKRMMIAELGEEGFKQYTKNLFRQGQLFHSALEKVLISKTPRQDEPHPPDVQGYMESISSILEDIRAVRAIESSVQHSILNYLGIVDCVARYRGVLCLIEWKTSEKPKPFLSNTYDNPVQVAAYAGGEWPYSSCLQGWVTCTCTSIKLRADVSVLGKMADSLGGVQRKEIH